HLSTSSIPWFQLSIVPFALGVFRYALRLDRGEGGAPEDIILGDRTLQVLGVMFVLLFALGTYTTYATGRRGPAIRTSPRRRVTPVASSWASSGRACLRVVPRASRTWAT